MNRKLMVAAVAAAFVAPAAYAQSSVTIGGTQVVLSASAFDVGNATNFPPNVVQTNNAIVKRDAAGAAALERIGECSILITCARRSAVKKFFAASISI